MIQFPLNTMRNIYLKEATLESQMTVSLIICSCSLSELYAFILVCQQLQHVIDNVRVLRLNNLNLQVYFPNGLLEVSKIF